MRMQWLVLALLANGAAHAASFDCTKAATPQEKAICASPQLSAADDRLAVAYRAVLAATPPEFVSEVRDEQRHWLRSMAQNCKIAESQSNPALTACMLRQYPARTKVLQGRTLPMGGVPFFWRSITIKTPDAPGDVMPAMRQYEANPGFGTLDASWPQARVSTPEWQAWNLGIESAAKKISVESPGGATGKGTAKWAAMGGVDTTLSVSIGLVNPEIVSATIEDFWDGHGAHPNVSSIQLNWLLNQKRELKAEDVFRLDSGWDGFLQTSCDRYLHRVLDGNGQSYENFGAPGEMPKALHGIVVNSQNWQLDGKGLTIVFQDYAVACHACTPSPLTIPWTELRPYLKSSFAIPK